MHWSIVAASVAESAEGAMSQSQLLGWAAGTATAIATTLSVLLVVWFRLIDRPAARWEIIPEHRDWEVDDETGIGEAIYRFTVSNVGTGPARLVSFIGVYCDILPRNGDKRKHTYYVPLTETGYSATFQASVLPTQWQEVRFLVTWTEPSHWAFRRKYRHAEFLLSDYFPEPALYYSDTDINVGFHTPVFIEPNKKQQAEIQKLEHEIIASRTLVLTSRNWLKRYCQFKKLRKAGWGWQRILPTINSAVLKSEYEANATDPVSSSTISA